MRKIEKHVSPQVEICPVANADTGNGTLTLKIER
jgi:hypothetical protein